MKRKITTLVVLILLISGNQIVAQNNVPVAVNDSLLPIFDVEISSSDTTLYINVLENDFDPNGEPIIIYEVLNRAGQSGIDVDFTDSTIILTMSESSLFESVFDYRVCKVNDLNSISNWAYLNVNPALNEDYPVARNDTVFGLPGQTLMINLLQNDYHPLGDSMFIYASEFITDSIYEIKCPEYSEEDFFVRPYFLTDTSEWFLRFDKGLIYIKILNNEWYDSLNVNNINARFNCFGNQFWNFEEAKFKVPNGSESTSIFAQSLWMGGLDETGNLHLAGEAYRQGGMDYWTGPVSNEYDSIYDQRWMHIWKLNRNEIEYHKAHWWETGYEPIPDIITWPGNGDLDLGQTEQIAPFEDHNNNGIYEPMQGEAPQIRGDQALFFVYNDYHGTHTETGGTPLGVEIRTMAYGFDQPEDSALWNTIFIHYDIENKSDTAYHDMYLSVFTDIDLGNADDDRIECDVEAGMYFSYNGEEIDAGGIESYGEHPPAQGILFLGGPTLEDDGIDNLKYDGLGQQIVDESINGLNFGDGVIDNERLGMTRFIYYNSSGGVTGNPDGADEMYAYMQNFWRDNTKVQYGGFGHLNLGAEGPDCNFMFPRDTDPYNWGTNGLIPNGGYNQNGLYWSEEQVNANPDDRRGLGSSGPFSFQPGQIHSLDIALPWARDFEGTAWSSAELLKERAYYIKDKFQNDPDFFSRLDLKQRSNNKIIIYPNPVKNYLKAILPESNDLKHLTICNVFGSVILTKTYTSNQNNISLDCSNFDSGIYIIQIESDNQLFRSKFIKK